MGVKALGELLTLFLSLGVIPLGPTLVATYFGVVWQGVALAGVWAMSWYVWVWARLRRE